MDVRFVCPAGGEEELSEQFTAMVMDYAEEMNAHTLRPLPGIYQAAWAREMLDALHQGNKRLEMCFCGETPIGFCYGQVNEARDAHPWCGCLLECYVVPAFRRKGIGRRLAAHMEAWLKEQHAAYVYLTADPATGLGFWQHLGYAPNGEIMESNGWPVCEKIIS